MGILSIHSRTLSRHDLSRNLTPRTDFLSIEQQHPRHGGQQRGDAAQQTTRRGVPETPEHLIREQGKHGGKDISREPLRGQGTRGVPMIHVGQVVEDGEVDGEDAHLRTPQRHDGGDPMHAREGRPAEPEKADR